MTESGGNPNLYYSVPSFTSSFTFKGHLPASAYNISVGKYERNGTWKT
jgi:hypothetical protein